MAEINIPKKQSGGSGSLFKLAGMGAGALIGGPTGAALGGSIGGAVGDMTNKPQAQPQAIASNALSRRQDQLAQVPEIQLNQSIDALKNIEDPEQRALLAQPLMQAQEMARKSRV